MKAAPAVLIASLIATGFLARPYVETAVNAAIAEPDACAIAAAAPTDSNVEACMGLPLDAILGARPSAADLTLLILRNDAAGAQREIGRVSGLDFATCDLLQRAIWEAPGLAVVAADEIGLILELDAACVPPAYLDPPTIASVGE